MWKGFFYTAKLYNRLVDEVKEIITGSPVWTILPNHIDDLKAQTEPKILSFTSTGPSQKVAHGLGSMPHRVALVSFKAPRDDGTILPTEVWVDSWDATDITVSSVDGTQIVLQIYPWLKYPPN